MNASRPNQRQVYRVQVLDRVFQILKVLAQDRAGAGLTEVANRLKLHRSTAHRLIKVLDSNSFVEKDEITGKYHIGSRLMELGLCAASRLDAYRAAEPYIRALAAETGETAQIGILLEKDWEVLSVVCVESSQMIRLSKTPGTRVPIHCTAQGKALLAFASSERVNEFLRVRRLKSYTPQTITSASLLRTELGNTRRRGYSFDNEEREQGLRCIGAPIRDGSGQVIAACSIAGPSARVKMERLGEISTAVMETATLISVSLGYTRQGSQS